MDNEHTPNAETTEAPEQPAPDPRDALIARLNAALDEAIAELELDLAA
mgnify:CR=1 FL=1